MTDNLATHDQRLELLQRFFNRTDVVAIRAPWGKPCPATPVNSLEEIVLAHVLGSVGPAVAVVAKSQTLQGPFRIGAYSPSLDGTTNWVCLDFDGAGHSWPLADAQAAAISCVKAFAAAGLPAYLERSGGGHGWHVWCFFSAPFSAMDARRLGLLLAPTDVPLADGGGTADARAGRGIEVFPKRAKIAADGFGNMVWLPWWSGAPDGANEFYRAREDGELEQYRPSEFETASVESVEQVLSRQQLQRPRSKKRRQTIGEAWRKEAVKKLPLDSVYSEWLTGNRREDWLECRDPSSPTGDQSPSAGVADGPLSKVERGSFHSFISGDTISVFDFLIQRQRATGLAAAFRLVAQLSGVPLPSDQGGDEPGPQPSDARAEVWISTEEWKVNNEAISALADDAVLFQRDGQLVHVVREQAPSDEAARARVRRPHLAPRIALAVPALLRERLSERIRWRKFDKRSSDWVPAHPPDWAVSAIFARGSWPGLRRLAGVAEAPVLRADGSILETAGYDPSTGVLYHPNGAFLPVPSAPSRADALAALGELKEVVEDFPFATEEHRSTWLAALLTPLARQVFDDCAPLFLFDANVSGSGKSLLTDIIASVVLGRNMARMSATNEDEEMRKRITSVAIAGDAIVLIDNIESGGFLGSPTLDMALTADEFQDRLLGVNAIIKTRLRMIWFATGNNVQLRGDMQRRVLHVRLESPMERPTERTGFRHDPLLPWVRAERPRLLRAALTVLRAHALADRPCAMALPALGSYHSWSTAVRAPLVWLGEPDPILTQRELAASSDGDVAMLASLVAGWEEIDPQREGLTICEVMSRLEQNPRLFGELRSAFEELCPPRNGRPANGQALAKKLQRFKGQISGGRALDHVGYDDHLKAVRWGIRDVQGPAPAP